MWGGSCSAVTRTIVAEAAGVPVALGSCEVEIHCIQRTASISRKQSLQKQEKQVKKILTAEILELLGGDSGPEWQASNQK